MRRLEQKFPNELVVIGVHSAKFPSEQLTENIRQAVVRLGIEHPVVNDAGLAVWNSYAVRAWPTLILVDPTGRIAYETSGEVLAEDLEGRIQELIDLHAGEMNREPMAQVTEAQLLPERLLHYPGKLLLVGDRHLFVADSGHHRILQVQLDEDGLAGDVLRVFGSGLPGLQDGPAASARFQHPRGLALKGSLETGTLYVADSDNHAIRAVDLSNGQVRTVAGTGEKAHGRYGLESPTQTPLRSPWDLLMLDEYLLIAMAGSHQIWILIDEEKLGPFAGSGREALVDGPLNQAGFNQPSGLALGIGHVFVADPEASAIRAVAFSDPPQVLTLVGRGLFEFGDRDGRGGDVLLQHPGGVAFANETVYIADTYNHKIKTLDPFTGQVTTLMGSGAGHRDGPLGQALFYEPEGVQANENALFIADTNNHEIRRVDLKQQVVTTLALRGASAFTPLPKETQAIEIELLAAPGPLRLEIDLSLPPGQHRSPDNPSFVRRLDDAAAQPMEFQAGQPLAWTVEPPPDGKLLYEVTIFHCHTDELALCHLTERRLALTIQPTSGGLDSAVIPLSLDTP